ncbi:MAG: oxidoreductase, partial [Halodesulfurarchaeum sp.]|nr:oxidoreductase [Halodesulfurarchaeum sp.]
VLPYAQVFTAVAMFGIVIVAGYLLLAMQRVLFGPFEADTDHEIVPAAVTDRVSIMVLLLIVILLGMAPDLIYGIIQDAVQPILSIGGGL